MTQSFCSPAPDSCSPALQSRGFSAFLNNSKSKEAHHAFGMRRFPAHRESKPSPLKRRATGSIASWLTQGFCSPAPDSCSPALQSRGFSAFLNNSKSKDAPHAFGMRRFPAHRESKPSPLKRRATGSIASWLTQGFCSPAPDSCSPALQSRGFSAFLSNSKSKDAHHAFGMRRFPAHRESKPSPLERRATSLYRSVMTQSFCSPALQSRGFSAFFALAQIEENPAHFRRGGFLRIAE